MTTIFPYDRSLLLNLENPDFVADLESFVGGLWRSDTRHGDLTMHLLKNEIPRYVEAHMVAKSDGIFSGKPIVKWFWKRMKFKTNIDFLINDGDAFRSGNVILKLKGPTHEILKIERTLLNVLQRLCGITTTTARYVKIAKPCRVAATRKTQWGLLDKYAVAVGGGLTHRLHLGDALLFKENHLKLLKEPSFFLDALLAVAASKLRLVTIEVETQFEAEILYHHLFPPLPCPIFILFDDFSVTDLKRTLKALPRRKNLYFEASGGIHFENLPTYAKTGVDVLSIGALTHSVPALDFSLLIE